MNQILWRVTIGLKGNIDLVTKYSFIKMQFGYLSVVVVNLQKKIQG